MRNILENCFIAACLAFVFWLVISAGIKFEVKIKGEKYGFTMGGASDYEREMDNTVAYWNNSAKELRLIVTDSMLAGHGIQFYLDALYPQYEKGLPPQRHYGFYYCVMYNPYRIDRHFFRTNFIKTDTSLYTVVAPQLITKNLDEH